MRWRAVRRGSRQEFRHREAIYVTGTAALRRIVPRSDRGRANVPAAAHRRVPRVSRTPRASRAPHRDGLSPRWAHGSGARAGQAVRTPPPRPPVPRPPPSSRRRSPRSPDDDVSVDALPVAGRHEEPRLVGVVLVEGEPDVSHAPACEDCRDGLPGGGVPFRTSSRGRLPRRDSTGMRGFTAPFREGARSGCLAQKQRCDPTPQRGIPVLHSGESRRATRSRSGLSITTAEAAE